jgi:cytoskeletal protein RodZ
MNCSDALNLEIEVMETAGEFFKQVRETKGLTLDAVASKTCIHPDFLRALEDNNYANLPDQVFAKGFVRSYARSLGLDENDAMRRFLESAAPFYEKQGERERLRQKQVEDERRRKTSRQVAAAAAVVALLALVLLLTREQSAVSPQRRPAPAVSSQEVAKSPDGPTRSVPAQAEPPGPGPAVSGPPVVVPPVPGPAEAPPMSRDAPPLTVAPADAAAAGAPSAVEAPLVLELEALELTWVLVRIDGGSIREALLRPGDRVRWTGTEQFALTLGNAGGVRVELDGKEQGPFGPRGKVARDVVLRR